MRPRVLDLFCGAGGAAMGLHRAGFDVVGIDIKPQPRYPFRFIQADALQPPVRLADFDLVWASPPCQRYSIANNIHGRDDHPDHVAATRALLIESGVDYCIENVPGAPLRNPVTLCGLTFGLGVKRHRWFETNFPVMALPCNGHKGDWVCVFGHTVLERSPMIGRTAKGGPRFRRKHLGTERGREAMGIDWMSRAELSEAIPPAYSEHIGHYAMMAIQASNTP